MKKSELAAIQEKYASLKHQSIGFGEASGDVNRLLDALPESPRNTLFRTKYADHKAEHELAAWNVKEDVLTIVRDVVPIEEPEELVVTPVTPAAELEQPAVPPTVETETTPTDKSVN